MKMHKKITYPAVSVIIPTYNEEKNIRKCIQSLNRQRYPKTLVEVIVIDDYSTDNTVSIAEQLHAKVIYSGYKHIEKSKSIGIRHANGELLLFIDADIALLSDKWLTTSVTALMENTQIVGVQNIYWHYQKNHSAANRYCELLGINDPVVYMMGKRGILGPFEKQWIDQKAIVTETADYWVAKFTPDNLPTLGSQGYLTRKELIQKHTYWEPYYFHLDNINELVAKGFNTFALLKMEVIHDYVNDIIEFHRKLYRNLLLYLKYKKYRTYTYGVGSIRFYLTVLLMVTVFYPSVQAVIGYIKTRDRAWFLHPVLCVTVPMVYGYVILKNLQNILLNTMKKI
jgi:glycosyltransferase involved in cell wall biosynthesis